MFQSSSSVAQGRQVRRLGLKSKARRRSIRRLNGFEPLEKREVLTAYGFTEGLSVQANVDVAIRGTDVQFSQFGLPTSMGGDIYTSKGTTIGSDRIGHYQEALTPILMDINNDQIPDFVGTTGVARFDFFVDSSASWIVGSVTTHNTSYIQGVNPAGQFLVGSQGTIVAGSGILSHVSGGFVSQSTVGFFPAFEMQTSVRFNVAIPSGETYVALVMAGSEEDCLTIESTTVDSLASAQTELLDAPVALVGSVDPVVESPQVSVDSQHKLSIDQNLALDVDWRTDQIIEVLV